MSSDKEIVIEGKKFKNWIEACKYYNISKSTVTSRLKNGMSLVEAFKNPPKKVKTSLVLEGREFDSLTLACKHYNLNYSTVASRIRDGWSVEEAFELKDKEFIGNGKEVVVDGVKYSKISNACKKYGINLALLLQG